MSPHPVELELESDLANLTPTVAARSSTLARDAPLTVIGYYEDEHGEYAPDYWTRHRDGHYNADADENLRAMAKACIQQMVSDRD